MHERERGFTLIEMIVALALLALISLAGLALVESVLSARRRTEGRLERLADLERAMTIVEADLRQVAGGPILAGAPGLTFERSAGPGTAGRVRIAYGLIGDRLERVVGGQPQTLLDHVAGARWSLRLGTGWTNRWPPSPLLADRWPQAVALDLTLAREPGRPTGTLRRVVLLPAHP